jgi:hypothetical protein
MLAAAMTKFMGGGDRRRETEFRSSGVAEWENFDLLRRILRGRLDLADIVLDAC